MKQGEQLHGFQVQSVRELSEQKATLYELKYLKNGAQLLWMDNGAQNKLFSIAFKTIPSDDTGVFHILEHSVLGGSKHYPVKDPFVSMMKGSLQTFLNAMTFPDKTVYPVSSRNETDFMNLVSVYLDAVFCPSIYDTPFPFYQEGWHYDLESADEQPVYKGVVFNEMKGALSSADALIEKGMNQLLFPDNCYRFESGGDPKHIPELTYEKYLEMHRTFYHPSNARIYLDGSVPMDKVLTLLDTYLSQYDKLNHTFDIQKQTPISDKNTMYYAIGDEEDAENRVQMAFGKIGCDYSDRKKLLAMTVLASYLAETNESPLKRALLTRELAQDAYIMVSDGVYQPYFYLRVCNTEKENVEAVQETVQTTVNEILCEGLNRNELDASICRIEFSLREPDEPQGLARNISILNTWLYDGDPTIYLNNNAVIAELRKELDTDYYENLLREMLLDWSSLSQLILLPSSTKNEEDVAEEQQRLAIAKASWSERELQSVLKLNRDLKEWQTKSDTPEALSTLPRLSLDQAQEAPKRLSTIRENINGVPVLFHPCDDDELVSFNLYFSLAQIPKEHWQELSFLTNILSALPTKQHDVLELQREIRRNIGYLDFNIAAYPVSGDPSVCKPYFIVNGSALKHRIREALSLIAEILNDTVYVGETATDMVYEILMQCQESMRQELLENGHAFAIKRAGSHMTAGGYFSEKTEGYSMYSWVSRLIEDFDAQIDSLRNYLESVSETIFASNRLIIGITASEIPDAFTEFCNALAKSAERPKAETVNVAIAGTPIRELIRIPSGVSYAGADNHLNRYNLKYNGAMKVLTNILSYEYLWNEVRVKGGAYGCGCRANAAGSFSFYSYRDPQAVNSESVFDGAADFLRNFLVNAKSIDNFILSSIASTEPLESLRDMGQSAEADFLADITPDDRKRYRNEMLNTTPAELLAMCDTVETLTRESARCIVGNPIHCDEGWKELNI